MKRFLPLVLFGLALSTAQAAILVTVNVDEFGSGSTDFLSPLHSIPSGIIADPTGSGGNVLVYALPFPVVPGELRMNEPPPGTTVILTDVLRWVVVNGASFLVFYSDNGDGVDATADIFGLPQNVFTTNIVSDFETGPDGANGLLYTPGAGNPGFFNTTDFTVQYNIVSDSAAPEPASAALIGAGLLGLGLIRRYRRN